MNSAVVAVFIAAVALLAGVGASSAQWVKTGGPEVQGVSSLVAVGEYLLAGTDQGVFVRTGDPRAWSPADEGMARREVFVSTNGGRSWASAGTGLPADVVIWSLAAAGAVAKRP